MFAQKGSININGKLFSFKTPKIMGILNTTPDSFYDGGKYTNISQLKTRINTLVSEGADIIDIGGMSSRPGSDSVSENEEWERLMPGLEMIREMYPDIPISVDTFRSKIARKSVEKYQAGIINDISAGDFDNEMFETIAELQVPYIIMHMSGTPKTMQLNPDNKDILKNIFDYFSIKIENLKKLGIHDIIVDPGFGFGKTIEDNYMILNYLDRFQTFEFPILCGMSRKSMIYKLLNSTPKKSLNGTSILNTIAIQKGCNLLRVHDVAQAKEVITIVNTTKKQKNSNW